MNLTKLTIENFKSFVDPTTIEFGTLSAGLYFMAGRNEIEPTLGSNGAGKSTVWEAWYWCLFGKTQRNLEASDVSSHGNGNTVTVIAEWVQQGQPMTLTRSWKPNRLTLTKGSGQPVTLAQEGLTDVVGLTKKEFSAAVFMGQGDEHFFDLTPSKKMEILQEALGLGDWLEYSKRAAAFLSDVQHKITSDQMKVQHLTGQQEELEKSIKQAKILDQEFETKKVEKINQALEALGQFEYHATEDVRTYNDLCDEEEAFHKKHATLKHAAEKVGKVVVDQQAALRTKEKLFYTVESSLTTLKRAWQQIDGLGATCVTCKQSISDHHKDDQIRQIKEDMEAVHTEYDATKREVARKTGESNDLQRDAREAKDAVAKVEAAFSPKKKELDRLEPLVTDAHPRRRAELKHTLEEARAEQSTHATVLEKAHVDLEENRGHQQEIETRLNAQTAEAAHLEYWVKGFKDIRLFLMDEAVTQLEAQTNQALVELGLEEWQIRFDVEREKKTGGIAKGFSVEITPPFRRPMPWEAWSGGESQRLRLAGRVALATLILSRRGIAPGIEIWDEPTQYLGEEGIEGIKEVLRKRAETFGIIIFLIDHRAYDFSGFEAKWTVVKTERGSHMEYA